MGIDETARLVAEAARAMADADDGPVTAETITRQAVGLVADAEWASLTVRARRGSFTTLAATHETARDADGAQYKFREGPCVEASTTGGEWLRSGDVSTDPRWPRWGPDAASRGVGSLLSVQLMSHDEPFGALNLYSTAVGGFSDRGEITVAMLYATHAAIALSSSRTVSNLTTALHSRHLIGVAQGILMERYGLDLERSFKLLRRYSNDLNAPLATVASDVVASGGLPPTTRTDA